MRSLRERLIEADGFNDTLAGLRADRAIAVVVGWLRDEAALADKLMEPQMSGYIEGIAETLARSVPAEEPDVNHT